LGVQGVAAPVNGTPELETAVAAQASEPNGALIVMPDTFTTAHRAQITALAAHHSLPAVYPFRFFAEHGAAPIHSLTYAPDAARVVVKTSDGLIQEWASASLEIALCATRPRLSRGKLSSCTSLSA
jgi:hypothetical protein